MFKKPRLTNRQLMRESARLIGPPTVTDIPEETLVMIREKLVGYDFPGKDK